MILFFAKKPSVFKSLVALAIGFIAHPALAQETSRPNILFCLADDWGWPHADVYGDKVIKTPTFDRLVAEGVLFENAYVSSPSCTPSRNAILTGQQFYRLKEGANLHGTLDVKTPNFMFLLQEAGYQIGHWRKAWGPGDYKKGGYTVHPCGPESDFATFLKERDSNEPFCFWFGSSDPHRPYENGKGRESGIPIDAIHVPDFLPDNETVRSDIADYYFEAQRWDSDVGKAIKLLEQTGELENTIIVMTGDHGMPFPRCKANLYDWGTRVPLAIRWGSKVKSKRSISDFVSFIDLAPTFLTAASVTPPESMTGKSMLPLIGSTADGRVDGNRDHVVFGRERHTAAQADPSIDGYPARGLRTDRWLLILNLKPDRWPAGVPSGATHPSRVFADCDNSPTKSAILAIAEENNRFYQLCFAKRDEIELYDCVSDPDQTHNLAANPEHAEVVAKLKSQLIDYLEKTDDPRFTGAGADFDHYSYH